MSEIWNGLLPVDKPAGPTSHDIVARIRSATGARRVGHTGTLDPPATGLLLILLGRATRLARFVPDAPKIYRGEFVLGVTTATDDLAGQIVRRHEGPLPDLHAVRAAAAARLGRQLQVPPDYSARSVGGTRLYKAARRGVRLEAPPAAILVERFEVEPGETPDRLVYELVVSGGTYVRAIVRDLGASLGCGAAVASLRRTAIGPLSVDHAIVLPPEPAARRDAVAGGLIPIDAMPLCLPSVILEDPTAASRFAAGVAVPSTAAASEPGGLVAVRDPEGKLLGIGAPGPAGLSPRVVLQAGV